MIQVTRCEDPSPAQSETIRSLTSSSFYCSQGFCRLWEAEGGRVVYWLVERAGEILAVLPGVEFGARPWRRFQAMPDGCYGRLFFADAGEAPNPEIRERLAQGLNNAGYAKLFVYDYYDTFGPGDPFAPGECRTTLVEVPSPEWQPPHESFRRAVRKAEKEGIAIQSFDPGRHLPMFLTLTEVSEKRHGRSPRYSGDFFARLALLAGSDDRIVWKWCEHQGEPVASHIYFVEDSTLIYWQGYFDKRFSFLRPNQYILFTIAGQMAQGGIRRLNLGASPEDAAGLRQYKERWGGREHAYNCYTLKSGLGKLL